MLKMGAGAILTALPAMFLWAGSHFAVSSVTLPAGLQAYPNALALRFLMASLLAYAGVFALAAGTIRTAVTVVSAGLLLLVAGGTLNTFLASTLGTSAPADLIESLLSTIGSPHGPLGVFTGSWTLIDV
jgi:hypothetical protein